VLSSRYRCKYAPLHPTNYRLSPGMKGLNDERGFYIGPYFEDLNILRMRSNEDFNWELIRSGKTDAIVWCMTMLNSPKFSRPEGRPTQVNT
jgi:hypothetical protein